MSEGKIIMRILRDVTINPMTTTVFYRATIRVYLKPPSGEEKDLASLINLQAPSPETLEVKINKVKESFEGLLKANPEFLKKVRVPEEREISEIK